MNDRDAIEAAQEGINALEDLRDNPPITFPDIRDDLVKETRRYVKTWAQLVTRLTDAVEGASELLTIAQEIANDSRCDLVDSERRIRLYTAIQRAGGGV